MEERFAKITKSSSLLEHSVESQFALLSSKVGVYGLIRCEKSLKQLSPDLENLGNGDHIELNPSLKHLRVLGPRSMLNHGLSRPFSMTFSMV